jgi:hypothetical protein
VTRTVTVTGCVRSADRALATYAASRHTHIVRPHQDSVSRLVVDKSISYAIALDKAFENVDCMVAILCR